MYSVYVTVRDDGAIMAVNSDGFLADVTGWTKIDEGSGDRFHHAQGNYLPGCHSDSSRARWRTPSPTR